MRIVCIHWEVKNEAYNKKDAHEWFMNKGKDFTVVCDLANLDPDRVHARYKWCLENKVIVFTEIQCYWIEYKNEYKNYRAVGILKRQRGIKEILIDQIRFKLKLKDKRKMKLKILKALEDKYYAKISSSRGNLEIYLTKSVGIGEHPQHIDEADKLVDIIAQNEEKLGVIQRLKQ